MTIQEFIGCVIAEPAEEPMTLFVSYAHREALICRLIVYALKARGHKVWFDELNIPHGSDWRSEILRGIENSSGVLSMLSRDAVKPGGVCLDELSIAVGVRGGNIRTVLLEQDVTPPPTLSNRQWLDLTEWQKYKNADSDEETLLSDPEFSRWFKEKVSLLIEMLETRENRDFDGQITVIRKALGSLYFSTSRQMFLLKEFHIERTWLREKVESWLDDPAGESVCIIYGDPGIGKSAFAAHYAHYNGRVATAVFCEKGQNALNSPEAVIQTLAYMLACRIPDYREYLANLLEGRPGGSISEEGPQVTSQNIGSLNVDEMFEVLLATPLLNLIDGERAVECILVDGLDEAGSIEQNELASVLQKYSARLPKWLRILVLSRNITAVQKWFGEALEINLTAEIRENRDDLEQFVREKLKEYAEGGGVKPEALEKAASDIAARSGGVFLYAKITMDALMDGKITLDEVEKFPRGLDQIYLRWFQWYVPDIDVYTDKVRPALNLMAASPEAIPEEEIIAVTEWKRQQFAQFKRLMQAHLREGTDENDEKTIEFNHLFVREWIVSPSAGEYQIYEDDGILELAQFFDDVISDDEPDINEFEARYVLAVMERAAGLKRSMRRAYKEALRNEALMKRQEALGRRNLEWNRLYTAREYLNGALQIAQCRTDDEDTAENRKHIVICKNRLAKVERALGHVDAARKLNEEALAVARQNIADRGLPEDLNRAAVALIMIADYKAGHAEEPLGYYCEAGELLEKAAKLLEQDSGGVEQAGGHGPGKDHEKDDPDDDESIGEKVDRNRSIVHNRMGMLALMRQDYAAADSSFLEDLQISQRLAMVTGRPEARRDFAVSCNKLAEVYRICDEPEAGAYYYNLALRTMDFLVKMRGQPDDIRGLIVLLNSKWKYLEIRTEGEASAEAAEPLASFERALGLSREMASKYGMVQDYLHTADSLVNVGVEEQTSGDLAGAVKCWKEACGLYAKYRPGEEKKLKKWIEECEV